MKNVLVIGYKGEIGSALTKVIENSKKFKVFKKDIEDIEIKEKIDIMHICIPYFDNFIDIVANYINKYKPGLVIINSTLRPGMTQKIYEKVKCRIVHSPVRGKHPHIDEGLLKAVKFIGPVDNESGDMAKEHFESLGIKTEVLKSSIETELGKLFSTTYYALCIAYHQEMERICKKFNADFDQTVTRFNETYNDLCKKINPKVVRPVLFPGFIGGHCLMPNIKLLKKDIESDFLDVIEKSNEKKKQDSEEKKMKILSVVGARPQFVKLAIFSREIRKHFKEVIVHTGQHYDYEMSKIFFKNLEIPEPDYNLGVGSMERDEQIRKMVDGLERIFSDEKPDLVIVFGDTNSTLAGARAASKLGIRLAHVESGMRSFDKTMPEEINRIETDKVSDILFCSTKAAVNNLSKEGVKGSVHLVGDIMIDALKATIAVAEKSSNILKQLNLKKKEFMVATIHRAGNTDDNENLKSIVEAFVECGKKIIFPVHPRTSKALKAYNLDEKLKNTNVVVVKPLSYIDMLVLEKNSRKILTDSGGMQKEAYFFKVPCITLRDSTEWVETVEDGWNVLTGPNKKKIIDAIKNFEPEGKQNESYGNGNATKNMVNILLG